MHRVLAVSEFLNRSVENNESKRTNSEPDLTSGRWNHEIRPGNTYCCRNEYVMEKGICWMALGGSTSINDPFTYAGKFLSALTFTVTFH